MLKALANIMSRIAPQRGTSTVSSSPAASHAPHGSGARGGRRLVVAKFDSAKTTPENRKHWANADGLSPNASINPEVRRVLRNRARYEVANNSYAKGIVLTLANDTIGTGPRLQMLTDDSDANARIEDAFDQWSRAVDLPGKLRTMRLARAESGEAFALLINNPGIASAGSPVSLDLKLIEADQVCTPLLRRGRNDEIDGIALDQWGNPSAYRVLKRHPGDSGVFRTPIDDLTAYDTFAASSVVHYFRPDRPGQLRGIPDITPALPLFAQLRRYTLATIAAAETAANFAAVIYTDSPHVPPTARRIRCHLLRRNAATPAKISKEAPPGVGIVATHACSIPPKTPEPTITRPSALTPVAVRSDQPVRSSPSVGRYVFKSTDPIVLVHRNARD